MVKENMVMLTVDGFSRNLLRPSIIRALCARAGMRPQRSAGQRYLTDARVLERIVAAVDPQPTDTILEIGAGFGVLTTALAMKVGEGKRARPFTRIIALEREHRVIPILKEIVESLGNVEVVEGDVLSLLRRRGAFPWTPVAERISSGGDSPSRKASEGHCGTPPLRSPWKLAANLPYGITSDFLRLLFDRVADGSIVPPERIVLLLQREVVDRMLGVSGISVLTILIQLHGMARKIINVPPSAFWPPPKVESAVITLDHIRTPAEITKLLHPITRDQFLAFVRLGFAHPRRQLITNLTGQYDRGAILAALTSGAIMLDIRPSALFFAQWIALARGCIAR